MSRHGIPEPSVCGGKTTPIARVGADNHDHWVRFAMVGMLKGVKGDKLPQFSLLLSTKFLDLGERPDRRGAFGFNGSSLQPTSLTKPSGWK